LIGEASLLSAAPAFNPLEELEAGDPDVHLPGARKPHELVAIDHVVECARRVQ
jgi:hypothetical protein